MLKSKLNNEDVISKIYDFSIGDRRYWKSKYNETVEHLNGMIEHAVYNVERSSNCCIHDTHWLSFHYAFHDIVASEFAIVKCKLNNSKRVLRCMRDEYSQFYYDVFETFEVFKARNYNHYCEKFIDWEKAYLKGELNLAWEDLT